MPRGMAGRFLILSGVGVVGLALAGCATFWDDVTSREFKVRDLYSQPDPMTVLRSQSQDGDTLSKAMRRLKEPRKNGGSDRDQDEAMQILGTVATTDTRPLCRLAAIDALGRFEDPRATAPLIQAYHNAGAGPFVPDHANAIRTQSLAALAHKNQSEAISLLVQIATTKPNDKPSPVQQASFNDDILRRAAGTSDLQAQRDIRLAAIRALGESRAQQAIPHLLPLLQEKDVAVRDRAHLALQAISGLKDVPADSQAWQNALAGGSGPKTS